MKDERGKKMWELLIRDETRSFEHAEFFPNNRINSVELSKAIDRVIQAQGARPRRFKFFRSQMQTIITRACNDAGIDPLPSRRCQTLTKWLDWRVENVYKQHPGFDGQAAHDGLRGELRDRCRTRCGVRAGRSSPCRWWACVRRSSR